MKNVFTAVLAMALCLCLCMVLGASAAMAEKLTVTAWDANFNGNALQRELHKAIQRLPEKQRLVFNMRYFDDMKYEDIAEITGTSVGALKASYHHAYNKIKESLENAGL